MTPIEEQIIISLIKLKESDYYAKCFIKSRLQQLTQEEPFGTTSDEFRRYELLNAFIAKIYGNERNYFMLWLRIEDYLSSTNIASAQENLNQVEEALQKYLEELTPEAKARGTAMLPEEIANARFMRSLYSLNNENLSTLFLKYLPAPRLKVFAGQAIIPEIITKREQVTTNTIKNVLERNENDLTSVEKKLVKVQRKFRAKIRKNENLQRLPHRYRNEWQGPNKPRGMTTKGAKALLADANKPYQPQCEEQLAKRIMDAAKKVELFSTVSHLTAATALESIFNDGLLGRRSILQFYMPFKPASLWQSDIEDGDANVVCLGANAIDPKARHGIELQFDAKKIAANNPCVFYKQRDLGFDPQKKSSVRIGDLDLSFSLTGTYRCQASDDSSMILYGPRGDQCAWAKVTKAILIADNLKEMHRILTLNFFRFADQFMNLDLSQNTYYKERIYSALSKLTDQELVETLLHIGQNMTDTMEFNFYGAYKIDFSALITIKSDDSFYTLNLPNFSDELKVGNLEKLNEAREKLPEIFNSYRFIDYLISTTNNERVVTELQEQRKKCVFPSWMEESKQDYSHASQDNVSITSKI